MKKLSLLMFVAAMMILPLVGCGDKAAKEPAVEPAAMPKLPPTGPAGGAAPGESN